MKMSFLCAPGDSQKAPSITALSVPCGSCRLHVCPSEDDQDQDQASDPPGVLSTQLIARAQKMLTEQHCI